MTETKFDLYQTTSERRFWSQRDDVDKLDAKIGVVAAFTTAATIPVVALVLAQRDSLNPWAAAAFACGLATCGVTVYNLTRAWAPRAWVVRPDLEMLGRACAHWSREDVLCKMGDEYTLAVRENSPLLSDKAGWLTGATWALALQVALFLAGAVLSLLPR